MTPSVTAKQRRGRSPDRPSLVSVDVAAKLLGVNPLTVRRWIRDGALNAVPVDGQKATVLRRADVKALVERRAKGAG
jgi:excisionase family DNA binding protein